MPKETIQLVHDRQVASLSATVSGAGAPASVTGSQPTPNPGQLNGGRIIGGLILDDPNGYISIGNPAPINSTTGTGIWIDRTQLLGLASGVTKFKLDPATGLITATGGSIGGWTIGLTALTAGSGGTTVGLDTSGTNPAIYAGSATPSSAPFRVTQAGALTATSGAIGGWTLSATTLASANITLDSGNDKITIGSTITLNGAAATITIGAGLILDGATQAIHVGSGVPRLDIDGANKRIRSSTYASGYTGFNIDGSTGNAEFDNVSMRGEVRAGIFTYGEIHASAGALLVPGAGTSILFAALIVN